mgnify:CR=1 FL=1
MTEPSPATVAPVIATALAAAVAAALPGFLIGALSVQVRGEFGVSESVYGWAMSAYFLAGTTGSIGLGRLAQRVGARHQLSAALMVATARMATELRKLMAEKGLDPRGFVLAAYTHQTITGQLHCPLVAERIRNF